MLETKIGAAIIVYVVTVLFMKAVFPETGGFSIGFWSALLALGVYLIL